MKKCMASFVVMFSICAATQVKQSRVVSGEEAERQSREQQEVGELYRRAAASRFVVIGTVSKDGLVRQRGKRPSIDSDIAGSLYSIQVEKTLCDEKDFPAHVKEFTRATPESISIFVPWQPPVEDGYLYKEKLGTGRRYLLFLVVPDRKRQQLWTDTFELDPQTVYYRGEGLSRGVIPLVEPTPENPKPVQPAVLDKVTRLCEAMRSPSITDKLAALNKLAASNDPILRKEAQNAMNALQTAPK